MSEKTVFIAGGGISGLSLAYYLSKKNAGLKIVVGEKLNRLGGNIITEKVGDFIIEGGPDCFISEKPWALELIKDLGLESQVIGTIPENNTTYILSGGKLHPLPDGFFLLAPAKIMPFVKSRLISMRGKFRALMDLIIPAADKGDETLEEFVTRRFGREMLEKIAEPLVAGIHAADPAKMSLRATFPRFLQLEKKYRSLILGMMRMRRKMGQSSSGKSTFLTLKEGLGQLIRSLEHALRRRGVIIHTGCEVHSISKSENVFLVQTSMGPMRAHAVVLAVPAHAASRLLRELSPEISRLTARIPFTSTVTLSAAFKREETVSKISAYGFLVPATENLNLLAVTFTSSKFPFRSPESHHLVRCFGGGYRHPEFVEKSEAEITEVLTGEMKSVLNWRTEADLVRVYRWKNAMPQYITGHDEVVEEISGALKGIPGLFLTGSSYRGIGISDCVRDSMNTSDEVLRILF